MKYRLIGRIGASTNTERLGRWLVAGPDGKPAHYGESKQEALAWIAAQRKSKKTKEKQAA